MNDARTLSSALLDALTDAATVNSAVQVRPAAVLWPDKDRVWQPAMAALKALLPGLCELGDYQPEQRRGPAIWLKCAIAGQFPELGITGVPVVYLPGVSRTELRAIETCPRDLQPLAELQYRGVFWSQANAKDWTLAAFMASKNGGLGLEVAQDRATAEALAQALQEGLLLKQPVESLRQKTLNAAWVHGLMAPNFARDLLQWMNEPAATRYAWSEAKWAVFLSRCKSELGFDPAADGELAAAERLAEGKGGWAAVAELYRDAHASVPKVYELLLTVKPPSLGLFDEQAAMAGYPKANEELEAVLRKTLKDCDQFTAEEARVALLDAEQRHAQRRQWLWSHMGRSPLAQALEHLARLAAGTQALPLGQTVDELAASYVQSGWQVDDAAVRALAAVSAKVDVDAVSAAVRAVYLPWLDLAAQRLQQAVSRAGALSAAMPNGAGAKPEPGLCTVFVDGLRYDTALRLVAKLDGLGVATCAHRWTSLPSVTASGKAWCSPVAPWVGGTVDDTEFSPRVAADGRPLSTHNFRKLLEEQGVQVLDGQAQGDPQAAAWVEAGDLDHYGHQHGTRLARDLDYQLDQVVERIQALQQAGWQRFRVVTDHGWLLMPGGLPKSELAKHQAETRWGRCAVLKDHAGGTELTFGWDWCADVQVAYAPGASAFVAGSEYAHGGISLQECLVPVIELSCAAVPVDTPAVSIESIAWRGLRCTVTLGGGAEGLTVDLRTKAAQANTSLLAAPKKVDQGKASLAVADDDQMGASAVVVVLNAAGTVIQKQATTVGD